MPRRHSASAVALQDALFGETQQRVLGLLFGQVDRAFTITELIALANGGRGAVQREVMRLAGSGLVTSTEIDGRRRYRANADAPIFEELRALVAKLFGVERTVRSALEPLREHVALALLYGSTAKGTATAASDIDILVVSDDVTLEDLFARLQPAEEELGRRINPTLYTAAEFNRRKRERHPFLTSVLQGKHHVLLEARGDRPAR